MRKYVEIAAPRASFPPFSAKVEEAYSPTNGSTFTLVLVWQDGSNSQPLVVPLGSGASRHRVLSAMSDYIQAELVKEVLES